MEIQALKLFVTEAEANDYARRVLKDTEGVEGLQVKLMPEGLIVQGQYAMSFFKVPFETTWEVSAAGPEVVARLASVRVAGLPAGVLKGALMKMMRDTTEGQPGIRVQDDTVRIDVVEVARAHQVPLRLALTAVRLSIGAAVIEAGPVA
jgi:hypothetical protein